MSFVLLASLIIVQPGDQSKRPTPPTAQQLQAAEIAGVRSALETTKIELDKTREDARAEREKAREDTFWSILKTAAASIGGSLVVLGSIGKWYLDWRMKARAVEHANDLEMLREKHKQEIEIATVNANNKKAENDDALQKLRTDFQKLEQRCTDEERKCADAMARVNERLAKEEAQTDALRQQLSEQREQLIILRATNKQSAFAGWTTNFDGKIIDVTPAGERQVLVPMGKTREKVEMQDASTVWPPALSKLINFLDDEAKVRPGHIAGALNVKVHPNLPPLAVVKCLATYLDGRAYGVQGIAIPMAAFVDVPDGLLGEEIKP